MSHSICKTGLDNLANRFRGGLLHETKMVESSNEYM